MNTLDQDIRRLLVECAFVAVNHSLFDDAEILMNALPWLTDNVEARENSRALILLGLGRPREALSCLVGRSNQEAQSLRDLIDYTLN